MEVAIKMALRLYDVRYKNGKIKNKNQTLDQTLDQTLGQIPNKNQNLESDDDVEDHLKNVFVLTQRDCYHGKKKRN